MPKTNHATRGHDPQQSSAPVTEPGSEPGLAPIEIEIDEDLLQEMHALARKRRCSVEQIIEDAIVAKLDRNVTAIENDCIDQFGEALASARG